jgi:FtsZ-binding cell division protein ZapB
MENVVEKLNNLESGIKSLIRKYKDLQVEFTILKEERDQLLSQVDQNIVDNKNKVSGKSEKADKSVDIVEVIPVENAEKLTGEVKSAENIKQIKLELESYISEIDQCIEIIQSK